MKALITTILALAALGAGAARILWVGIDDQSLVHLSDQTLHIADWFSAVQTEHGCDPVDIGGRIRIGDTVLLAGYSDPSGYIPPGQSAPTILFDPDITEFGLLVVDQYDEPTGAYADWQPIQLNATADSDPEHLEIYFDIGYWDANSAWEFVPLATAVSWVDTIWSMHSYESGTLLPPGESPWRPVDFYAVPEPSTCMLLAVGMLLMTNKRKHARLA